jgi:hypothetical protein
VKGLGSSNPDDSITVNREDIALSTYKPAPIETSAIGLSEDLVALTEKLAENAHDNWARQRFAEGWKWGPKRDDAERMHPDLVPYSELSESEKAYDRNAAMETLKAIIALGYRIESAR